MNANADTTAIAMLDSSISKTRTYVQLLLLIVVSSSVWLIDAAINKSSVVLFLGAGIVLSFACAGFAEQATHLFSLIMRRELLAHDLNKG